MGFVIDKDGNYLPVLGETSGGGGGGGTSNHAQLSHLDYATSGHTGFMSSENFIAHNAVISVKSDGTGDYTNLIDAVNSLTGKWSNGTVIIEISSGTYNTNQIVIDGKNFNIPCLKIEGQGINNTTFDFANMYNNGAFYLVDCANEVQISKLYVKCAGRTLVPGRGINIYSCISTVIDNVKVSDSDAGICVLVNSNARVLNCTMTNCNIGSWTGDNGRVFLLSCTFNTVGTGLSLYKGATIGLEGTASFTSVTTKYSQSLATTTANGIIYGTWE